jgi:hypothetical protein
MTDGLNNKNSELITLLTATNDKLDTVITLLGGAPPSTVHTIDDLYDIMADVHLDTQSIDQKLLIIRNATAPAAGDTEPVIPLQIALSRIYPLIQFLQEASPLDWGAIMGIPATSTDNVLEWLSGIGHVTGDATTTILGRLTAIEGYSACACGPMPPSALDPSSCADPYTSVLLTTDGAYSGRLFASFPDPPPFGLVFDDVLGLSGSNIELNQEPSQVGWRFYGLSAKETVFSINPTNPAAYPTNQWVDLPPTYRLAFNVPSGSDLVVYLCGPGDSPPFLDCVDIPSALVTVTYQEGISPPTHTRYYTPLSDLGLTVVSEFDAGGQHYAYNQSDVATTDDMMGVKTTLLSGTNCHVVYINTSGSVIVHELTTIGQFYTVTESTTLFLIDNFQSNDISPGSAYTVELCPAS